MEIQNTIAAKYSVEIELRKSPTAIFNHIINLRNWWPEDFAGEEISLNSEFIFSTGDSHYSKNKVIEFVPNKKFVWITTESLRKTDNFDWTGTKMIFELTPKEDATLLKFTYDGVVIKNESERLIEICDFVIKVKLYNLIESFSVTVEVANSPQEVFNCINDVDKWWSKDYEGNCSQLNDEFVIYHPNRHYSKQKLVEVIPYKKIVWLVTDSTLYWLQNDQHEWTNTKMIFELTTEVDKTILQFTHEGLFPRMESYSMCEKGWTMIITNWLLYFITNGSESPEMTQEAEIRNKIHKLNT